MEDLIKKTIEKIRDQRISPDPRWKFLAKKYALWIIFAAILVMAAVSFSVALHNAGDLDWDLYHFMPENRWVYFISIFPYFWAILIVIFLIAAFFEIRRTETGYRYSRFGILAITVGGILTLGISMTVLGFGGNFHSALSENFPVYSRHMMVTKESQWMRPEKGFLAGTIISADSQELEIKDLDGADWNIQIDEKTLIRPAADISREETIKIIGKKQDANSFQADEIRPWVGKGMMGSANNSQRGMKDGGRGGMMRGN